MPRLHTTLILPDVHVPWQNTVLMPKVCQLALDIGIDWLVIAGDYLDLYSLSRHNKGSLGKLKTLDLSDEYEAGRKQLDAIDRATKGAKRDYLYGNHEDNYLRWIDDEDNAKVGKELGSPEKAMRLRERGYKVHTNWKDDSVRVGAYLDITHAAGTAKHVAFNALQDYEGSVAFGHTHRFQTHVTGKRGAYNLGFLGDRDSAGFKYMPAALRRKWCNGFGVAYTLDGGDYLMHPVQCWNNRFVFNGKLY